ncbi:uncharacterized protein LOC105285841 [Ooceraea biroi]|nr:uncharacterized protein LOC105285841 [Ooceraea biroi]
MRFRELKPMLDRIKENAGETTRKPFRLYIMSITHVEIKRRKRRQRKAVKRPTKIAEESVHSKEMQDVMTLPSAKSESSLIESVEWVTSDPELDPHRDVTSRGFTPMRHYSASMLEIAVLENYITTPTLAPFKESLKPDHDRGKTTVERMETLDRTFRNYTSVAIPIDLCVMAWSLIHDPASWSERTFRGLFEASVDYALDSVLASEDTSVGDMTDALLPEFEIANYAFRAVFAPLHFGTLYATEGWNLAMTLCKIFETKIYTGAIIVCHYAHVGVTKKGNNYFAWWTVTGTKNLRMITSRNMSEFLKLIVKEIDAPQKTGFVVRAITISYARKLAPDWSDIEGLHEPMAPTTSLAKIHRKESETRDIEAIFKPIESTPKPIFIHGTVALRDRDSLLEPRAKRCYFVALLAVVVKRDIVQSPLPAIIDKILEVAESLYREFSEPKFHVEHILRNVPLMNRFFDLRDCASSLVTLTTNPRTGRNDFLMKVKKCLKCHFKMYTSGILHFTNCCYGFWYSRSTNCYYYLDPYQCDARGRKTLSDGNACLCIFSSVCQMVKHMCLNQHEGTTGFFLHRIHVDSIDTPASEKFQEDPMWVYLDYHWNFTHSIVRARKKRKVSDRSASSQIDRFWHNYVVEVTGLIYSIWGTIGAYDCRFGDRAGKNRTAICVAVLAIQNLCHPSRWSPAILDSAVICGDTYYTESLRSLARECSQPTNRFGLRSSLRLFPHVWTVDFGTSVCGVLYDDRNRLTLTAALKLAFEEARNIIVECNNITLAVSAAKNAYYVADPCWIGPPLFVKDRGAIYTLCCRNVYALVYAITKMINTNQRLGVRVTPVLFTFDREDSREEPEPCPATAKILSRSLRRDPGRIDDPGMRIPGATAVPDESSYPQYLQRLARAVTGTGSQLEECQLSSRHTEPALNPENVNNTLVSAKWRLNLGQARPPKRPRPPLDLVWLKDDSTEFVDSATDLFEPRHSQVSITDLTACDYYPKPMDFASNIPAPGIEFLECASERSFIREQSRTEFDKRAAEMSQDPYKSHPHRPPVIVIQKADEATENAELSEATTTDATEFTDSEF